MAATVDKDALFAAIKYVPHPKQWLYHRSKARFRTPVCGRRFGKSTMAGRDLETKLLDPSRKQRFWICGPTYDLAEKEFRVIWDDLIIGAALGRNKRVKKVYNKKQGEMRIEMPWGTLVECRSAQHPETLVGESLDHVIVSEAAKHKKETWERFIRACLADRRGSADFPTTPEGQNWLYGIWQFGQREDLADYESWRFPSWDNPAVYPGGRNDPEILQIEATTAPEWFMQEIGADFTSFVGRIYSEFDELTHVRPIVYQPGWKNYIAFDWGFVHPLAAVEFMVDPFDNIWIWREHVRSYWRVEQHVEYLRDGRENPDGYHLDLAFGDAADPEAASYVTQHLVPCWALPEAKNNWRNGVDLVKTFLREHEVGILDEFGTPYSLPKLFVSPNCPNTIKEFNNYRAKADLPSNIRESGTNSAALKMDDDCMDAIRYALVHIFQLGCTVHLEDIQVGANTYSFNENRPVFTKAEDVSRGSNDQGYATFFSLGGKTF
jgi:hypothetical protein